MIRQARETLSFAEVLPGKRFFIWGSRAKMPRREGQERSFATRLSAEL
jgi:hypothetical protein